MYSTCKAFPALQGQFVEPTLSSVLTLEPKQLHVHVETQGLGLLRLLTPRCCDAQEAPPTMRAR
jgi:hypothetical protein